MLRKDRQRRMLLFSMLAMPLVSACRLSSPEEARSMTAPVNETPVPIVAAADGDSAVESLVKVVPAPLPPVIAAEDDPLDGPLNCAPPGKEDVELHVYPRSTAEADLNRLADLLKRDGFVVLFVDSGENLSPVVAVQGSAERFNRVFRARLENNLYPRSAGAGFYCQLMVTKFVTPKRYKKLMDCINAPDPQVY